MLRTWVAKFRQDWHNLRTVLISCAYILFAIVVLFVWEANVDQFSRAPAPRSSAEPNQIETTVVADELTLATINGTAIFAGQSPDLPAQVVRGHVYKVEAAGLRSGDRLVTADGMGTVVVTDISRQAPSRWIDVTQPVAGLYDHATGLGSRAMTRLKERVQSFVEAPWAPLVTGDEFVTVDFQPSRLLTPPDFAVAVTELGAGRITVGIERVEPSGSRVVLVANRGLYDGKAVRPGAGRNLLTQVNTGNQRASFTLTFPEPQGAVTFTVPAVRSETTSGITFPAWKAVALSAAGIELSSASLGLLRRLGDEPAKTFTLTAPGFDGISAVKFESDPNLDGRPFAAFSGILIEELKLKRLPVDCARLQRLPACQ